MVFQTQFQKALRETVARADGARYLGPVSLELALIAGIDLYQQNARFDDRVNEIVRRQLKHRKTSMNEMRSETLKTLPVFGRLLAPAMLLLLLCGCVSSPQEKPPIVGGQEVPNQNIIIDFTKRYDLLCRYGDASRAYSNCRILGYTGDKILDAEGKLASGFFHNNFGRWLALELPDGRHAFVPSGSIAFLEEAKR